jgi:hypothetical protein
MREAGCFLGASSIKATPKALIVPRRVVRPDTNALTLLVPEIRCAWILTSVRMVLTSADRAMSVKILPEATRATTDAVRMAFPVMRDLVAPVLTVATTTLFGSSPILKLAETNLAGQIILPVILTAIAKSAATLRTTMMAKLVEASVGRMTSLAHLTRLAACVAMDTPLTK